MTTEAWIDVLERAQHLEQSARRLLNKGDEPLTEAEEALKVCADAFEVSRLALATALRDAQTAREEAAAPPPEPEEPAPAFEITP